jgi:hypothetical protein
MASTVLDVVNDTRQHVFTGAREEINLLQTTFSSAAPPATFTVALTNPLGGIQNGARLEIDVEIFRVLSVNATAMTATCIGGQDGSVVTSHTAGALVTVNPKFPSFRILRALQQVFRSIGSPGAGLYQYANTDFTITQPLIGYDFPTTLPLLNVHRVYYRLVGQTARKDWQAVPNARWKRNLPTGDFPSGQAIFIPEAYLPAGTPIRVIYRAPLGDLGSNLAADVGATTGLLESAFDIPSLGAAIQLVAAREIKRNFTEAQPEPRRAAEVPPGATMQSINALRQLYLLRLSQEAAKLSTMFPPSGLFS